MSGFSPVWLALREPADHAARSREVLQAVAASVAGRESLTVIDLGCGAGSNLRGCAGALPVLDQRWTLVDGDPALLAAARTTLMAWADRFSERGDDLLLTKGGHRISVSFARADLVRDVASVLRQPADLVTAAALFDLASSDWMTHCVHLLAARGLPLYAALTYDGNEAWLPAHGDDRAIHRAFLSHQRRDKGFGPSVGPKAAAVLSAALRRCGYTVVSGRSPWQLSAMQAPLAVDLAVGIAAAACETGGVSGDIASRWLRFRRRSSRTPAASVRIGHRDLWATPRPAA